MCEMKDMPKAETLTMSQYQYSSSRAATNWEPDIKAFCFAKISSALRKPVTRYFDTGFDVTAHHFTAIETNKFDDKLVQQRVTTLVWSALLSTELK